MIWRAQHDAHHRVPGLLQRERVVEERQALRGNVGGFSAADRLYVCPQSLFKFHPDFDAAICEILRRDKAGRLILIDQQDPNHKRALLRRLAASAPEDILRRVVFVPQLPRILADGTVAARRGMSPQHYLQMTVRV